MAWYGDTWMSAKFCNVTSNLWNPVTTVKHELPEISEHRNLGHGLLYQGRLRRVGQVGHGPPNHSWSSLCNCLQVLADTCGQNAKISSLSTSSAIRRYIIMNKITEFFKSCLSAECWQEQSHHPYFGVRNFI